MIPKMPKGFTHPICIGRGGFASVYRARQTSLDRWVAVKIVDQKNASLRLALLKEGKTQAKVQMKNIPQIYDAFEWQGRIFIIMQWIRGVSLLSILEHCSDEAVRLSLADAFMNNLAELHTLGYAHRDLKPQNIIISPEKGMYFVDFAFAKHRDDRAGSMEAKVKGTPGYIAPELWRGGKDADYLRADLYSAGVIMREILGGEAWQPFIAMLTDIDPLKRPPSAALLIPRWNELKGGDIPPPDWVKTASDLSNKTVAEYCMLGAKELIGAARFDEAYWLLVESLEENPDNSEAVSLISRISGLRQKKKYARTALCYSAAGAVAALVILSFVAGRYVGNAPAGLSDFNQSVNKKILPFKTAFFRQKESISPDIAFMNDTAQAQALSGELVIVNHPKNGYLAINETMRYTAEQLAQKIVLPGNRYLLAWKDTDANTVWREKITLLPFQKKVINMPESIRLP